MTRFGLKGYSLTNIIKRIYTLAALTAVLLFIGLATPGAHADDATYNYVGNVLSNNLPNSLNLPPTLLLNSDSLDVSITFNAPLAPNLSEVDLSADIVSWTIDDADGYIDQIFGGGPAGKFGPGDCPISSTEACAPGYISDTNADYAINGGFNLVTYATFSTDADGNIIFDTGGDDFEVVAEGFTLDQGALYSSPGWDELWANFGFNLAQPPLPATGLQFDINPEGDWYGGFGAGYAATGCGIAGNLGEYTSTSLCAYSGTPGTWTEVQTQVPEPSTLLMLGTGLLGLLGIGRRKFLGSRSV